MGLVLVAYLPAMTAGWVWDDDDHVTKNAALHDFEGLRRIWLEPGATPQYYPLVFSSFWVEYQLWQDRAGGYHVVNVVMHALNAWLVWHVLSALQVRGAWFAAAVFALHPVHVESVAWVTERKNVLSGLLYLASLSAFLQFQATRARKWYAIAFVAYLAALLSKTVTCSLPAVLILLTWWREGRVTRRDWLLLAPWFALGLGFALLTIWMEKTFIGASGSAWSLTAVQRCLVAGNAIAFYLGKLIWPSPLIFIYPRWDIDPADAAWYIAPVLVVGVILCLWLLRGRLGRGPLVAVLIFAGTLVPALGFFDIYPFRYSFVADHFQYLASVPLIALAAAGLASLPSMPRAAPAMGTGLLLLLGVMTCRRTLDYRSEQRLWEDTLAKYADCSVAHARLGMILADREHYAAAADHFREVVRLNPESAADRLRLANLALAAGQLDEVVTQHRALLTDDPDSVSGWLMLARALMQLGRPDEAAEELSKALGRHPNDAGLHIAMGLARAEQRQLDQAIEHVSTAIRLDPSSESSRRLLQVLQQARKSASPGQGHKVP
jgi:Flp pilus assembly protein TadD